MRKELTLVTLVVAIWLSATNLAPVARAAENQDNKPAKAKSPIRVPILEENTINKIVDRSVRQTARRYDLSPEQTEVARSAMERNIYQFVNQHYDTLFTVFTEMYQMRLAGKEPEPDFVKSWSEKFYPLYKEAADIVVRESEKFSEILDEKQKEIHKKDMSRLDRDLDKMNERLDRWRRGEYRPGELTRGRSVKKPGNKKAAKRPIPNNVRQANLKPTSFSYWDLHVKTFIEAFQLDTGQQTLAMSLLAEMKTKAQQYKADHARQFGEVRTAMRDQALARSRATTKSAKPAEDAEMKKLRGQLNELNQPIVDMYNELAERLMKIPTAQQRAEVGKLMGDEAGKSASQPATSSAPAPKLEPNPLGLK